MAYKRPFDDEVVDEGSIKHQRQDEPNGDIRSCNGDFSLEGVSGKFYDIGESSNGKHEIGTSEELENGNSRIIPTELEYVENDVSRSASLSHWATISTSDEDDPPEETGQLPFYPGYFSFDHPVRTVINPEDVYYCLLDYPPRKRVPVGPDHQADVPCWGTVEPDCFDGEAGGTCVIPIPKIESLPYDGEKVGCGRVECTCMDLGSVRCVRQHIAEARDKLKKTLGRDTFMELGFDEMGEIVADKWSVEEEHLFHEVVYSNPFSSGKNFWNVLTDVFSSRTKMEIVSYYFNVFMLRKRAEQNRCDPLNIDSDNDEWQGSDDECDEDGNSGIESPVHNNIPELYQNGLHLHEYEYEHEHEHEHEHDYEHEHEHEHKDDVNITEDVKDYNANNGDVFVQKSDLDSSFELSGKKSDQDDGENDVQDGSSISSDSGAPMQGPGLKADGCQEWNEYIVGSSDVKPWDGFRLSCPKQSVEFLPTCSMIEEVFGDGDFDSKTKRW